MATNISGRWVNQNGSIVEFEEQQGVLSGVYISRKGRSAAGKQYPLTGVINGEVLAFAVNWQDDDANLESITSFTGRLERRNGEVYAVHTMWVLARRWENEERTRETGSWNAFLTNADVFHRED
ncbi:MAG: avidin/streptavidin family protein [Pseudomonadales bacterium]